MRTLILSWIIALSYCLAVFKKLFDLMFVDFGWAATEIDEDIMKIYKIVKKYKKGEEKWKMKLTKLK